jgi:hypothetical protein
VRTFALAAVLGAAFYLLYAIVPTGEGLSHLQGLWPPLLVGAVTWYAASLVNLLFKGRYAAPLVEAIRTAAITLFGCLLFSAPPPLIDPSYSALALPTLLVGCLRAGLAFIRVHSWPLGVLMRVLLIVAGGFWLQTLLTAWLGEGDPLAPIALPAMLAVAAVSLLALLSMNSNPFLAAIGRIMGRQVNLLLIIVLLIGVTAYVAYYRPGLMEDNGDLVQLVEWALVALAIALIAVKGMRYMRAKGRTEGLADWSKLVQVVAQSKEEVREAGQVVGSFVDRGEKERLLVMLTSIMRMNGVAEARAAQVIAPLVRYSEPGIGLGFRWAVGDEERRRRRDREDLVKDITAEAAMAMNAGHVLRQSEGMIKRGASRKEG